MQLFHNLAQNRRVIALRARRLMKSALQTELFYHRKWADPGRYFRLVCVYSWSSFHFSINWTDQTRCNIRNNAGQWGHHSCSLSVSLKASTTLLNWRQYKIKVIIKTSLHFTYLNEAIFDSSNRRLKFDFVEYYKKPRQKRVHLENIGQFFQVCLSSSGWIRHRP